MCDTPFTHTFTQKQQEKQGEGGRWKHRRPGVLRAGEVEVIEAASPTGSARFASNHRLCPSCLRASLGSQDSLVSLL